MQSKKDLSKIWGIYCWILSIFMTLKNSHAPKASQTVEFNFFSCLIVLIFCCPFVNWSFLIHIDRGVIIVCK